MGAATSQLHKAALLTSWPAKEVSVPGHMSAKQMLNGQGPQRWVRNTPRPSHIHLFQTAAFSSVAHIVRVSCEGKLLTSRWPTRSSLERVNKEPPQQKSPRKPTKRPRRNKTQGMTRQRGHVDGKRSEYLIPGDSFVLFEIHFSLSLFSSHWKLNRR